uniref:MYND-type domain-containing protein n=1 Tax=Chromera velia CCMP2878 TaxID=1169474 RepID=A0A0G4HUU3_9ALVE|mmetsp:Transcript_19398/g.39065  ORF Transcript_19398/g.39065 Transcript_19398/m.39065 type:complete len:433 (-) Transcript_19398:27-1325(-)|eukprot:Cvel_8730.t1-p1 / transcript=Cvel_8730.t1 / gene=Cvel_8730 / organism=Chromera_velia_CCMP2878 / gene_product=hypothetical protein / transcript_product=hypothetical protein / location=Cvel_scaffold488:36888-38183(-) / protein_length=432 / sequence_SO=supercontig / SO=protein_coding / is_pseudo=false
MSNAERLFQGRSWEEFSKAIRANDEQTAMRIIQEQMKSLSLEKQMSLSKFIEEESIKRGMSEKTEAMNVRGVERSMQAVTRWVEREVSGSRAVSREEQRPSESPLNFSSFPDQDFLKVLYHASSDEYLVTCYEIGVAQWAKNLFEKLSPKGFGIHEKGEEAERVRIKQLALFAIREVAIHEGSVEKMRASEKECDFVAFLAEVMMSSHRVEYRLQTLIALGNFVNTPSGGFTAFRLFNMPNFETALRRCCFAERDVMPWPFFNSSKNKYYTVDREALLANEAARLLSPLALHNPAFLAEVEADMDILAPLQQSRVALSRTPKDKKMMYNLDTFLNCLPADVKARHGIPQSNSGNGPPENLLKMDEALNASRVNPKNVRRCAWHDCGIAGSLQDDVKLSACTGCRAVYYCSRACQKKDWKAGHKDKCREGKKG